MNDERHDLNVGGLDVLTTGLNLAVLDLHGGDGFWPEVQRFARESQLDALIDQCMGGRAAPRLWAFMESPGSGQSAAAAALGVATLLADRGQAVVLLDTDEQEPRITRWLGRSEQEGWIDMVRFGASLHAASDPLPSDNRRGSVVGVGSFSPTGVTPEEVGDLLGRLRHQADDLVLVVPAKLRSLPWLEEADIRLLCWDLLSRSRHDTETIIGELDRMGARPEALLGFGVEEYTAIQGRLQETGERAGGEALLGEGAVDEAADDTRPTTGPSADEALLAEAGPDDDAGIDVGDEDASAGRPRRRTSGVFVAMAVVAVVALVAVGVFLAGQWRSDGGDAGEIAAARIQVETPGTGTDAVGGEPAEPGRQDAQEDAAPTDDPTATVDEATTAEPTATGPAGEEPVDETGGGDAARVEDATTDEPEPAEPAPAQPEPVTQTPATPEEPEPQTDVALDIGPFEQPVGEAGWTVWLSSLPTEADAVQEVADLRARGLVAEFRAVDLEERGTWYRVYTGSFTSRAAVNEAVPALKTYLNTDWAVPARY
ncbi:hypothetical protein GF314_14290 [bacterium]|nr:hypothetical protein [bacterium]